MYSSVKVSLVDSHISLKIGASALFRTAVSTDRRMSSLNSPRWYCRSWLSKFLLKPLNQCLARSICTSVNHVVCHGIPADKKLKSGDFVNIDITVIKDGFHGDSSRMFAVGKPSTQGQRLAEITKDAMWRGIECVRPGARLGDIGYAIQDFAESQRCAVVREYCGHGIGRVFHEDPQVLHYGKPGTGMEIVEGMTFTIEPMLNAGRRHVKLLGDGWTVVTKDHSLSAQWEHTILVTADGYEVLTLGVADR